MPPPAAAAAAAAAAAPGGGTKGSPLGCSCCIIGPAPAGPPNPIGPAAPMPMGPPIPAGIPPTPPPLFSQCPPLPLPLPPPLPPLKCLLSSIMSCCCCSGSGSSGSNSSLCSTISLFLASILRSCTSFLSLSSSLILFIMAMVSAIALDLPSCLE